MPMKTTEWKMMQMKPKWYKNLPTKQQFKTRKEMTLKKQHKFMIALQQKVLTFKK